MSAEVATTSGDAVVTAAEEALFVEERVQEVRALGLLLKPASRRRRAMPRGGRLVREVAQELLAALSATADQIEPKLYIVLPTLQPSDSTKAVAMQRNASPRTIAIPVWKEMMIEGAKHFTPQFRTGYVWQATGESTQLKLQAQPPKVQWTKRQLHQYFSGGVRSARQEIVRHIADRPDCE